MKPICGIRTVKGAAKLGTVVLAVGYLGLLLNLFTKPERVVAAAALAVCILFLWTAKRMLRRCLIFCFPVTCGHRRCIFTGKSSRRLQEIILLVDNEIPTEEQLQEFKDNARVYLNDIKSALENTMTTSFQYIFSGSAVERYGIPVMMSYKNTGCMCASGGFLGYAQLTYITSGVEKTFLSSELARKKVFDGVQSTPVVNLPGIPCCCGKTQLTPKIRLDSKGPAMKLRIEPLFEADVTICVHCSEWPPMSDWSSRPRYWPSVVEAQRIMSHGCHLVAKPAPSDQNKTSWRFSFSLAEVELSKLVPDTARKCFLALKIILKDHLQPVVPRITTYHIKTIFLNTLEKVPVSFWVEGNIEECFLTLLAELRDALKSTNCPHYWFSFINLFDIKAKTLLRLAKKVERIMKDPAPFILDDGCCCLSPCCVRVLDYSFTPRSSEQFHVDYDEVSLSTDGQMMVDPPGNRRYQLPVTPSSRTEDQLDPNGEHVRGTNVRPEELVVSLPPLQNAWQESSFYADEAENDPFRDTLPLLVSLSSVYHA
ncbi:hypothetical protein ACROYT_G016846 [Oculina patagonica]